MKRIIDGVTYNTDTSTMLATSEYETEYNHNDYPCEGRLYQTRGGAFFIRETVNLGQIPGEPENDYRERFRALSQEEAQGWIMTGDVEVIHNPFDDPPEATAEAEPSTTVYSRVPALLKQRVDQAAKEAGLSGNAWHIRCMESCLIRKIVEDGLPTNGKGQISASDFGKVVFDVLHTAHADANPAQTTELRGFIEQKLPTNGRGQITAAVLREALLGAVRITQGW